MCCRKIVFAAAAAAFLLMASSASGSGTLRRYPEAYIPPHEHPRLYLRGGDIPRVKAGMDTPQGREILNQLKWLSAPRTPEEEAQEQKGRYRYYFRMRGVTSQAQLEALAFLTRGDEVAGRHAITSILDTLKRTEYGRKNDMSRASGAMLMVGAMVYDWCYPLMEKREKMQYIEEFKRIAATMECDYPPQSREPITGHPCEWMVLRDLLSAGIAVYDEDPSIYDHTMNLIWEHYVPARNYIYSGHSYHQGPDYTNVRFTCDLIAQWIIRQMGCPPLFDEEQMHECALDMVYRIRPDGLHLAYGDTEYFARDFKVIPTRAMFFAAMYWKDRNLLWGYGEAPWTVDEFMGEVKFLSPHCLMMQLLWSDFSLTPEGPSDLPLIRWCGTPFGYTLARTGWGRDDVLVEMKVNEKMFANHQHLDGGAFQIYYKGPLAIDSGTYSGLTPGGYGNAHNVNYFKRTIAHNSLLIYDPDEKFPAYRYGDKSWKEAANDGGQRLTPDGWKSCNSFKDLMSEGYTFGKVVAHHEEEGMCYLVGDLTPGYNRCKVSQVRRTFLFMETEEEKIPAVLVIFDKLSSTDASFRKTFLLHSIDEPLIRKNQYEIRRNTDGDNGMLHCTCLLPRKARIGKVGGAGHEFEVQGINYPNDRPQDVAHEYGCWRVEISPEDESLDDNFLNIIQIADADCTRFLKVKALHDASRTGAQVGSRTIWFDSEGIPSIN